MTDFLRLCLMGILVISTLESCGLSKSKALEPKEYISWYKKTQPQLSDTVVKDGVRYVLIEKPVGYEMSRLILDNNIALEDAKESIKIIESRNEQNFILKLKVPESTSDIYTYNLRNGEPNRVKPLNQSFNNQVKLITTESDTISCSKAILIPGIANTAYASFELFFELVERKRVSQILLTDPYWSGKNIVFNWAPKTFIVIPELSLK